MSVHFVPAPDPSVTHLSLRAAVWMVEVDGNSRLDDAAFWVSHLSDAGVVESEQYLRLARKSFRALPYGMGSRHVAAVDHVLALLVEEMDHRTR